MRYTPPKGKGCDAKGCHNKAKYIASPKDQTHMALRICEKHYQELVSSPDTEVRFSDGDR